MSVRPVALTPTGLEVEHAGHGGTVTAAGVDFARNPDGTIDPRFLLITCPFAGCGAVSVHPVGGGAAPRAVQRLFLRLVRLRAAALGIPTAQRTHAALKVRLRQLVTAMDGSARWALEDVDADDDGRLDGA
jgi:hypothetical protein